jgi:hypothetical protein
MKARLQKLAVVSILTLQVFFYPMIAFADTVPVANANTEVPSSDQSQTPPATAATANSALVDTSPTTSNSPVTYTRSTTATTDTQTDNRLYDLFYNNALGNTIGSASTSGNSIVTNNTTAGNATSGDATSTANILNILQSSFGIKAETISTFTTDLFGTYFGDIQLDPNKLPTASKLRMQTNIDPNLAITIGENNILTDTVNLIATSGTATVSGNTTGGDATSGDAVALANLVNMISSSISTNQSFIGNINIRGDLDGDILLPDALKQQLLSSNAPTTTINLNKIENANVVADITTDTLIDNSVTAGAVNGNATVNNNTTGGNATSGDAKTTLTVLNLTGQQVIGSNALLVFVNVMGKWVGAIMNAPVGTTAAILGDQKSSITQVASNEVNMGANVQNTIKNNINIQATSGDASITGNTTGGNATSGNALTGVSLANTTNSTFSLADWLGILFINVLGTWNGSFGTDTSAGGITTTPSNTTTSGNQSRSASPEVRAFHIVATNTGGYSLSPIQQPSGDNQIGMTATDKSKEKNTPKVLAATTNTPQQPGAAQTDGVVSAKRVAWPVIASIIAVMAGSVLIIAERLLGRKSMQRGRA